MGITVALETEDGQRLAMVEDPTGVLNRLFPPVGDRNYRCLSWIDPYGNTVFNRVQAPQLLAEWETLASGIDDHDAEAERVLDSIRRLIARLRDEVHLYLKFYGD